MWVIRRADERGDDVVALELMEPRRHRVSHLPCTVFTKQSKERAQGAVVMSGFADQARHWLMPYPPVGVFEPDEQLVGPVEQHLSIGSVNASEALRFLR